VYSRSLSEIAPNLVNTAIATTIILLADIAVFKHMLRKYAEEA